MHIMGRRFELKREIRQDHDIDDQTYRQKETRGSNKARCFKTCRKIDVRSMFVL